MKYFEKILIFLVGSVFVFIFWIAINGFNEIAKAPENLQFCQKIDWAQAKNKNDFWLDRFLALWTLKKINCDTELQPAVSTPLDKNPMASVYVCYFLADSPGREADLELMTKIVTTANHSPSFDVKKNSELVNYVLDEIEAMDANKRVFVYDNVCKKQITEIRKAIEQGQISQKGQLLEIKP